MITKRFSDFVLYENNNLNIVEVCESYIDSPFSINTWKGRVEKIFIEYTSNISIVNAIDNIIQEVETERGKIEKLLKQLYDYLKTTDNINVTVDNIINDLETLEDMAEKFRDILSNISKSYYSVDESITNMRRFE